MAGREKRCSVNGCENEAYRSISMHEFSNIGKDFPLTVKPEGRTIYFCKEHYKLYKKVTKKYRKFEKYRRGMGYI